MPDVTITIPARHAGRVKAAVQRMGPQLLRDDMPPVADRDNLTDAEMVDVAQAMVAHFLRDLVKQVEAHDAVEQARRAALKRVDDDGVVPRLTRPGGR